VAVDEDLPLERVVQAQTDMVLFPAQYPTTASTCGLDCKVDVQPTSKQAAVFRNARKWLVGEAHVSKFDLT
jgi:hypothetical protein